MKNVGGIDKTLRIIAGLALLAVALIPSPIQTLWAFIGIIPLVTGLIGWCPLYSLVGLKTCPVAAAAAAAE